MLCLKRIHWHAAASVADWFRWSEVNVASRTKAAQPATHLAVLTMGFTTATEVLAAFTTMALIWVSTQPVEIEPRDWMESYRLTVESCANGDRFGGDVALDGGSLLIGACSNDVAGPNSGAAYLFNLPTGGRPLELGGGDREPLGAFGCSLAVSGTTALVGMPADGQRPPGTGAAFVYEKQSNGRWKRVARLFPSDATTGGEFGICVALHEKIAVVTGRGADGCGQVYVFRRDECGGWREAAKLRGPNGRTLDFGLALATDGQRVLVGAPLGRLDDPAVYLFELDAAATWQQVDRLTNSAAGRSSNFGHAIAFAGDDVIVGAPAESPDGAVHVFRRTDGGSWDSVLHLASPFSTGASMFGSVIACDDQTLAVGAPSAADGAGAVHVYQRQAEGDWHWMFELTPGKDTQVRRFGRAVAISDGRLLVGAPLGRGASATSGAAYLFSLDSFDSARIPIHSLKGSLLPSSAWVK